jgi:hypothetical protein
MFNVQSIRKVDVQKTWNFEPDGCPLVKACRHFASAQQEIEPALLVKNPALLQLDEIAPIDHFLRLDRFCSRV